MKELTSPPSLTMEPSTVELMVKHFEPTEIMILTRLQMVDQLRLMARKPFIYITMMMMLVIMGHLLIQGLGTLMVVNLFIVLKEQLGQVSQILAVLLQMVLNPSSFMDHQVLLELLQTLEY
jgi:hypothetical protein